MSIKWIGNKKYPHEMWTNLQNVYMGWGEGSPDLFYDIYRSQVRAKSKTFKVETIQSNKRCWITANAVMVLGLVQVLSYR